MLQNGDTFDMLVFDVSSTYSDHLQRKQNKQAPDIGKLNPEQVQELSKKYYGKDVL